MRGKVKYTFFAVIFLLVLISSLCCYAEKNIKPAKIVTLKGDTVAGKVKDWNHKQNPDSFVFIRNGSNVAEWMTPAKIKAVIIDGTDYFVSAKVKLDMFYSTKRKPFETYVRADKAVIKNLFLCDLLSGKLCLYKYVDENRKEHFFAKTMDGEYKELVYKRVPIKPPGAKLYVYEESRYKDQLRELMADCISLAGKIDWMHYTERELTSLFDRYNDCDYSEPVNRSKSGKNKISLHALAGIDITYYSFTGRDYFSHLENSHFKPSVTLLPGLRCMIPLQKQKKQWYLVSDFANRSLGLSSHYYHSTSEYDIHMYMDYVKWNMSFKYKLSTPSVEPYIDAGLALNYLVDFTSRKVQTGADTLGQSAVIYGVAVQEPHPFDFGYFGGLGLHYKRLNLEGRYEQSTGFSPVYDLDSHVTTVNVILSFRLGREE
jgi:hypothetical protein